jgi:hypothetical protein
LETAGPRVPRYSSDMNIDRKDADERQARLDLMINEFRDAQSRRLAKAAKMHVDSPPAPERKTAVARA